MDAEQPRPDADGPARRAGQLRLDPGPGAAQLLPDHEQQRAAGGAVARGHARTCRPLLAVVSLVIVAAAAGRLLPDALEGLPGHLGRPAARGRRRPDRRRGPQRRPGRQGLRPGAAGARAGGRGVPGAVYGSQMRAVRLQARYQPLLQAIPVFGQVAVLALGGWMALHHEITLGTFLAFSTYITQLVAPAQRLAGVLTIAQQARAGRRAHLPAARPAPGHRRRARRDRAAAAARRDRLLRRPLRLPATGAPVLRGFDLHVAGRASGSPSSARAAAASRPRRLLVSRFYDPQQGAVLVDGHDVRDVTLHSLRSQIGVVFEESFLFSESVRDNIAYGRPGRQRRRDRGGGARRGRPRLHRGPAARLRHGGRRTGPDACRAASVSGSPWPGRCSTTRGS